MRNDLEIITLDFPLEQDHINVYAIGDVHVGSPQFNEEAIKKKIQIIHDDPYGVVAICGDLGDFGLKNSKSNVYKATMQPQQQIEYIYDLFYDIRHKISACVPGNHEERITREVGTCPLYDLCVRWGIEDKYRENVAITRYKFGKIKNEQQAVFYGVTVHGTSKNKNHRFMGCFDCADFGISGHSHTPGYTPNGRIRIERNKHTARHVAYKEIVVDANLTPGGYSFRNEYEIAPPPELQYLELSIYREQDSARTLRRVMNYHSIEI